METFDKGILIIDDEDNARSNISQILRSEGYLNIHQASTLAESLTLLKEKEEELYLVLLDILMPDGNGLNLMQHLLNNHDHIIGIIVITGHGSVDVAVDFFKMGSEFIVAANFNLKPIHIPILLDQIRSTIKLIDSKRNKQNEFALKQIISNQLHLEQNLNSIESRIISIERSKPSFIKDLGLHVLRLVIIGLLVITILYFGWGRLIQEIISNLLG